MLPTTWDLVLLSAMAIFIQSLSPHKAVGWGVMILFYVFLEMPELKGLIEHTLLRYGNSPAVPLSDLTRATDMRAYLDLVQRLLDEGVAKGDRTGTGVGLGLGVGSVVGLDLRVGLGPGAGLHGSAFGDGSHEVHGHLAQRVHGNLL